MQQTLQKVIVRSTSVLAAQHQSLSYFSHFEQSKLLYPLGMDSFGTHKQSGTM